MKRIASLAVLVLAVAVPAAAHSSASAAKTRSVKLADFTFTPKVLTISRGTTVRWLWKDGLAHNVTSRGTRRFRSSTTKSRGSYSVRFTKAGTYRYVCTIHASMKAKIVVRR